MPEPAGWVVAAGAAALRRLEPLIAAHDAIQPVRVISLCGDEPEPAAALAGALDDAGSALIVGNRRRAPRTALPGLFLHSAEGRPVPTGWLPDAGPRLEVFARAAATVLARARAALPRGPLAVLAQRQDAALRLAALTSDGAARDSALPVLRWTAERLSRTDLLGALRSGVGLAIYVGHGRSCGWVGYQGVRASHLAEARGEPAGAILSLCCAVGSRHRIGTSFAEELVLSGICGAALGATGKTLHVRNGWLAKSLCQTLARTPVATLAELLLAAELPPRACAWPYRIVGDPSVPLIGAADALERARRVAAPGADDPLPPHPEPGEWGMCRTEANETDAQLFSLYEPAGTQTGVA